MIFTKQEAIMIYNLINNVMDAQDYTPNYIEWYKILDKLEKMLSSYID